MFKESSQSLADELLDVCQRGLRQNVLELDHSLYLCAGQHQFKSLWTRDFCFSIPGICQMGRSDVAEFHLQKLINARRSRDALIPRLMDSLPSALRVTVNMSFYRMGSSRSLRVSQPLRPEYLGEHRTESIDSNFLVILMSIFLGKYYDKMEWLHRNQSALEEVFQYYCDKTEDGLIRQNSFSDWQDSAKRKGLTSYTNALYLAVLKSMKQLGWPISVSYEETLKSFKRQFYDEEAGLFLSEVGKNQIGLDTQLLLLDYDILSYEESLDLYSALVKSEFWVQYGLCNLRNYSLREISWTTQLVGLKRYHGKMIWSWLVGYSLKIARKMKDEKSVQEIINYAHRHLLFENQIYEIYSIKTQKPFKNLIYRSESPFSWGCAKMIEGLN